MYGLQFDNIGFDQCRKYVVICMWWSSWNQPCKTKDQPYYSLWLFRFPKGECSLHKLQSSTIPYPINGQGRVHLFSSAEPLRSGKKEIVHLVHGERVPAVLPFSWVLLNEIVVTQEWLLMRLPKLPGFVEVTVDPEVLAERLQAHWREAGGVKLVHRMEESVLGHFLKMQILVQLINGECWGSQV